MVVTYTSIRINKKTGIKLISASGTRVFVIGNTIKHGSTKYEKPESINLDDSFGYATNYYGGVTLDNMFSFNKETGILGYGIFNSTGGQAIASGEIDVGTTGRRLVKAEFINNIELKDAK